MKNIYKQEQEHLDETISGIELKEYEIMELQKRAKEANLSKQELYSSLGKNELEMIKQTTEAPYFGSIEILDEEGDVEHYYIGKQGIRNQEEDMVVVDWRRPFAAVYNNFVTGSPHQSYFTNEQFGRKEHTVEVLNKRSYLIERRTIKKINQEVADTDSDKNITYTESGTEMTITDSILRDILEESSTNGYLKEIIATIQREQNMAIREPISQNLIVQGVAGSGKSSIALHRMSYLLYNNRNVPAHKMMILAPSAMFIHSIQGLLPELELQSIKQKTYAQLVQNYMPEIPSAKFLTQERFFEEVVFEDKGKTLEYLALKGSKEFVAYMDSFLVKIQEDYVQGIQRAGFSDEWLEKEDLIAIYHGYGHLPYERQIAKFLAHVENHFTSKLAEKKEQVATQGEKILEQFFHGAGLTKAEIATVEKLTKKTVKHKRETLEERYAAQMKPWLQQHQAPKLLQTYQQLVDYVKQVDKGFAELYSYRMRDCFDPIDMGILMYLYSRLRMEEKPYVHIVIDEAQDLSYVQLAAIKELTRTVTIIGDEMQSINVGIGQTGWGDIVNHLLEEATILKLHTSYRSTQQIAGMANTILQKGFQQKENAITPFSRSGPEVAFTNVVDGSDLFGKIMQTLDQWQGQYKRIAVIHKDAKRAKALHDLLKRHYYDVGLADVNGSAGEAGITIVTSYDSKGMEFDAVIIPNANDATYDSSELHAKLLYVVATRAQKELVVLYQGRPSPLLGTPVEERVAVGEFDGIL